MEILNDGFPIMNSMYGNYEHFEFGIANSISYVGIHISMEFKMFLWYEKNLAMKSIKTIHAIANGPILSTMDKETPHVISTSILIIMRLATTKIKRILRYPFDNIHNLKHSNISSAYCT